MDCAPHSVPPIRCEWRCQSISLVTPSAPDEERYKTPLGVQSISTCNNHIVAVDENGDVWQWGVGTPFQEPTCTLRGHSVVQASAALHCVLLLTKGNRIISLPLNPGVQPPEEQRDSDTSSWFSWFSRKKAMDKPLPSGAQYVGLGDPSERIVQLATGREHGVILTHKGGVYVAALTDLANQYGQLGIGPTLETITRRKPASDKDSDKLVEEADKAWLGMGTFAQKQTLEPDLVGKSLTNVSFVKITESPWKHSTSQPAEIACGAYHTLLRCADGTTYGWGSNRSLQLCIGPYDPEREIVATPVQLPIKDCTKLAAASETSFFACETERQTTVLSAGHGLYGTLGTGQFTHCSGIPTPVHVISGAHYFDESSKSVKPRRIRYITAGNYHVAAVLETSTTESGGRVYGDDVYVWGANRAYQLGTGKHANCAEPISPSAPLLLRGMDGIDEMVDDQGGQVQMREGARIYCGGDNTVLY